MRWSQFVCVCFSVCVFCESACDVPSISPPSLSSFSHSTLSVSASVSYYACHRPYFIREGELRKKRLIPDSWFCVTIRLETNTYRPMLFTRLYTYSFKMWMRVAQNTLHRPINIFFILSSRVYFVGYDMDDKYPTTTLQLYLLSLYLFAANPCVS